MGKNRDMEKLIEKIDSHLESFPQAETVNILEGDMKDMASLLYTLKGRGAVGLFETDVVQVANEKNAVQDLLYSFEVDREIYEKFKDEFRHGSKMTPAKYDPKKMVITCRNEEIHIPPDTNLAALCGYMFSKEIGTRISWDIIYLEIAGVDSHDKLKDRKKVYDAVMAANTKFGDAFDGQALFDWAGKSVVRLL